MILTEKVTLKVLLGSNKLVDMNSRSTYLVGTWHTNYGSASHLLHEDHNEALYHRRNGFDTFYYICDKSHHVVNMSWVQEIPWSVGSHVGSNKTMFLYVGDS